MISIKSDAMTLLLLFNEREKKPPKHLFKSHCHTIHCNKLRMKQWTRDQISTISMWTLWMGNPHAQHNGYVICFTNVNVLKLSNTFRNYMYIFDMKQLRVLVLLLQIIVDHFESRLKNIQNQSKTHSTFFLTFTLKNCFKIMEKHWNSFNFTGYSKFIHR